MASRVVVITGASAGVGRAAARAFAERGDAVALIARGARGLEAAAAEVEAHGSRALPIQADVADAEQMLAAARRVEEALGDIDVWVNNAMTSIFAPVWDVAPDEFRRVTEVTYLGSVHGVMAALRHMRPRDRGVVVQVGSALAYRGIPLQSAYCGAKHAIQGFTESVRTELLHERSSIRIVQVHLPALNTPQFDQVESRLPNRAQPVPPIYQPEVAARAIVFAAEHPRREIWVGATTAITILANRIAPVAVARYLARTGVRSQQTHEPRDPMQPSNLWRPVDERVDLGAHGRFDDRAYARSPFTQMGRHRGVVAAGALSTLSVWAWRRRAG